MKENILKILSIENIKLSLFRSSYGLNNNFLAKIDGRVILIWYLFYVVAPWLVQDNTLILLWAVQFLLVALACKVSKVILGIMAISVFINIGGMFIMLLIFSNNFETITQISVLSFKILVSCLATACMFKAIGPEKLSDSLLRLKVPQMYCFGISYGYKIIPIFIDEFVGTYQTYKIRDKGISGTNFKVARTVAIEVARIIKCFYPIVLNTNKRFRTIRETLELKGFTYSINDPEVIKLKTSHMKLSMLDLLFSLYALLILLFTIIISKFGG
ncbi:MAG: hypothetical protein ATN35_00385 [Epulopiscium sp. Nele67-Bin004]|nr:MAG: hypothetical protein ATN35_00385 [Epulopiscium sp. Nele67-Bin004]